MLMFGPTSEQYGILHVNMCQLQSLKQETLLTTCARGMSNFKGF